MRVECKRCKGTGYDPTVREPTQYSFGVALQMSYDLWKGESASAIAERFCCHKDTVVAWVFRCTTEIFGDNDEHLKLLRRPGWGRIKVARYLEDKYRVRYDMVQL